MKYNRSVDGIERCSIDLDIRLTREDTALLNKVSKAKGYSSIKAYLLDTIPMNTILWEYVSDDVEQFNKGQNT